MTESPVEDIYPLSPMQQGLLFHSLWSEAAVYVQQEIYTFHGPLNAAAFERAWREVMARHPALRSAFLWQDVSTPLQLVFRKVAPPLVHQDWSGLVAGEQERRLEELLADGRTRRFDLDRPPLLRQTLVRTAPDRHHFVWSFHHLLLDGWSRVHVLKEVLALYEAFAGGQDLHLAPAPPFRNFIAWLQQRDSPAAERFWREELRGFSRPTPLSTGGVPGGPDSAGDLAILLPAEVAAALRSLCRRWRLTFNTLVQGAWAVLLSRYSGEEDVLFGATVSGRPPELSRVEETVGLFINTLPVRVRAPAEGSLLPWLAALQDRQLEMRQHEHTPLVQIQGWSEVPRGIPLFESLLVFENYPSEVAPAEQAAQVLQVERHEASGLATDYPLALLVAAGSSLSLRVSFDRSRFSLPAVRRILEHLETLLRGLATAPARISDLELLTGVERAQLLVEWNDTARMCRQVPLVHELFAEHARRRPEATAVASPERRLTYGELEGRSNRLAHRLQSLGVGPEVRVAICTERTLDRVVGIVGVLKAGGAYVSLDPAYPKERLTFLLEDAGAPVLLTERRFLDRLPDSGGAQVLCLDGESVGLDGPVEAPASGVGPDNLAYVVYTSGSTGRPKGVEIPHAGLMNLVRWHQDLYEVGPADRGTQIASPAFDASIWELWPYLAGGASVHIPDEETRLSSPGMIHWWAREGITLAYLMTPLAEGVLEEAIPEELELVVRALIIGGDRLHRRPAPEVGFRLMNHYGPAEYTVTSTVVHVPPQTVGSEEAGLPSIGRPVDNTRLYVLDRWQRPVPIGVSGELYVAGLGLARGYLGRADLTAEKFVPDPFGTEPGTRMYRTADLVRYLPDGEIDFLGRLDHQVKIRGLRIELGEIESVLGQHPEVREVAVLVREDRPGDKRLVAYLVPSGETRPPFDALRGFLQDRLPAYMVPAVFLYLDNLPLTPNGKVDRRALPAPGRAERAIAPPRTPTEEMVTGLWSKLLRTSDLGVHDNFFDLGGHSLLATSFIEAVRRGLRVDLPLRTVFERPTPAELAESIDALARAGAGVETPPLLPVSRERELPLSFAQQRLWFIDRWEPGSSAYNIPSGARMKGELDLVALTATLDEIARRHEVLRTVYPDVEGQPVQRIEPARPVDLPLLDLAGLPAAAGERELSRLAREEWRRPFDLARGPVFRTLLVRLDEREHAMVCTLHHIASDGWSTGVLMGEVTALYGAFAQGRPSPLPELPVQYADFASWQREWLQGAVLDTQVAYWRERLSGLPVLDLPTDRPRPAEQTFRGERIVVGMPPMLLDGLKALAHREDTTLFMVVLAAFAVMLGYRARQEDMVVGTNVAGRSRAETAGLIGHFLNMLVLRIDLSGGPSFHQVLGRVRGVCLDAYAHQDLPFDRLVEALRPKRDPSRHPLFQVKLDFQNAAPAVAGMPELTLAPLEEPEPTAHTDLTVYCAERSSGLEAAWEYNTDLFDAGTVLEMAAQLESVARCAVRQPDAPLAGVYELLAEGDHQRQVERERAFKEARRRGLGDFKRKTVAVG